MSDRFIREPECKSITGLSRTTRWRLEQHGDFPKRYQLSPGISAYKASEVAEWLESRDQEKRND